MRSGSKANASVGGIIDGIKSLKEGVTIDEVKSLATGRANVPDNQIDRTSGAADYRVQRTRPYLRIG
jgi:hypothetical protein